MRRLHRGRLFRKYFLLILLLVCGTLVISGGIGLYFAYQENKVALASLQREKAGAAAARIEAFVQQIEQQLSFAALPVLDLEQRKLEFEKVLRMAQAVTDIAYVDAKAREQLVVSRLAMNVVGSGKDRSQETAFREAKPGQTWFGPVYFRKDTEPYMTIAIRTQDKGAVTQAEVNLKFIWDVITRIKIGQKGKAYVVDDTGHLIADPDIGLVLRKTNLSHLGQVKAALAPDADASEALLAKDLGGNNVLTAYAPIEPGREHAQQGKPWSALGWKVFVEQPVSEVFAALDATILRTVALLFAGLLFSALAALSLARSMVRPISTLQDGAARIGAGDLEQKIDIHTGDELESLADEFNRMSAQLRESYAGLERKVDERTAELKQALEFQGATGEILSSISSSIADTQPVFDAIVRNLLRLLDTQFAAVQLIRDGSIELVAIGGHTDIEELKRAFPQPIDDKTQSGRVIASRQVMQIAPITTRADVPERSRDMARAVGYESLITAPMVREDKVIGVVSTARREPKPFDEKQVALIKAFADQAVIAIENARLFNETKEALEQQTATAEILKVISSSPTDVQPVLDAIVKSASGLFAPCRASIIMLENEQIYMRARAKDGVVAPIPDALEEHYPLPRGRAPHLSRSLETRAIVEVPDTEADETSPFLKKFGRLTGTRSVAFVPLVREGEGIGALSLTTPNAGFVLNDKQRALARTFADQAVIAIENVRLFNETKEALEQQTATSDILQVTSKSPTDVKPVFDTILENAIRLCEGNVAMLWTFDGQRLRYAANHNATEQAVQMFIDNPLELGDWNPTPQAAFEKRTVHVLDVFEEPRYRPLVPLGTTTERPKAGTVLAVPLLRDEQLLGVITIWRYEKRLFSDKQLAMVNTFAAQAVIAIENVRLFNETKESLEQQTAISEILRVISSSPSDVRPVLEAVAERAARICDAHIADIILAERGVLRPAAAIGSLGRPSETPLDRSTVMGRSIVDKTTIHVADLQSEGAEYPTGQALAMKYGHRTILAVPLLRENRALGTILLRRAEVRPFEDKHIALLKTFADQAAIAIENVRLFNETKEALEQQTATAEVLNVISGSITDTRPVFDAISRSVLKLYAARNVSLFVRVGERIDRVGHAVSSVDADDRSQELYPLALDEQSLAGRAILRGELIHIEDAHNEPGLSEQSRAVITATGSRSVLMAPMQSMGVTTGALSVSRRTPGRFSEREVELLGTFADQAVIAMENVRLFNEIQEKSRQLEIANKHKSDFLANMSHELRTPLNAIIGFSEVLMERMFGEVNAKQADYLKDIHESGKHLLSLINDILDLSKIEAGRMDLEISSFDLPSALSNAMTLVRERAQRHGIELGLKVDPRLGEFRADERKFKQIVLNLLSNAVKFTPDGGRVDVSAKLDTDKVEIAVKDTGIGIAPEDHAAVFEEFKQVGRDVTRKAEGTGLGLALTRRFVELHGGSIGLNSAPGKGSTFTITLPVRS